MAGTVLYRRQVRTAQPRMAQPSSRRIGSRPISGGEVNMRSINLPEFELEIGIEELEPKVAPDGGETVLPLPIPPHGHK
jgi:hypothetical protein